MDDARRTRPGAGISKASATRLIRPRKWRRQADNQGRVLVPIDALSEEGDVRRTDRADIQPDMRV
jgi:hypothetical protein